MRPVSSLTRTRLSADSELDDLEVRARLARRPPSHRHPLGGAMVAPDRRVDRAAARLQMTLDEGGVGALDLTRLDLGREVAVGPLATRDDHQAGGVAVEAVDDPGALGLAARGDPAQHVDERAAPVPRRRVDDEAGGLVDDDQPVVAEDERDTVDDVHQLSARRAGSSSPVPSWIRTTIAIPTTIATSARLNVG